MGIISKITDALGGNLLEGVNEILGQFIDDPQEVAEAEQMIMEEERKIQEALLEYEAERMAQRSKTVRAEIHSDHWLASNWRPILMLTFGFIAVYAAIAPALGAPGLAMDQIPNRAWNVMMVGIGGYVAGRSAEKIIPNSKWGPQNNGDG